MLQKYHGYSDRAIVFPCEKGIPNILTEDYITEVYCLVDDMLKKSEKTLRSRGPHPKLSDAEVIAMEIVGESTGMDEDKAIHRYFRDHWHPLSPELGTRTAFLRQSANLWTLKQQIREDLRKCLLPSSSQVCITGGGFRAIPQWGRNAERRFAAGSARRVPIEPESRTANQPVTCRQ